VAAEQVVFVAAGAVRASQAADQEDRNAHRHQDSQEASVRREPMDQMVHIQDTHTVDKSFADEPRGRAVDRLFGTPESR
jgi:hypothetical protein